MNLTPPALQDRLSLIMTTKPASFARDDGALARAREVSGLPLSSLALAHQVHGASVSLVDPDPASPLQRIEETDALITNSPDLALGITTADCTGIMLYDPSSHALGLIHAGWRGTLEGVLDAALGAMGELAHTAPDRCHAVLGPAIGPCCYQVGEEILAAYRKAFGPAADPFFQPSRQTAHAPWRWHFDLRGFQTFRLREHGIPSAQITVRPECTSCDSDRFFSYRRDRGLLGRHLTLAILKTV